MLCQNYEQKRSEAVLEGLELSFCEAKNSEMSREFGRVCTVPYYILCGIIIPGS